MPAKVKVRILAGRNLPVMDKSSDASDAFVEVKLGNTTYKTEVYRRSLNPFWNSEWFRFEVSDQELQDEPLQIRIMDYDTYSANDAIGKVYINLNPLLVNPGRSMSGWLPIYDTLHGIRGEINCMVKVNLFPDNNRYRHSSCGVRFFFSDIPNGYKCDAILGFVDELLVNDDPEYQWIDKIRTPRASNEARQTLFTKLSGEVQRKLGLKAEIFGGNAVIGYQQSFDLEGGSGIVGRGIGTAVVLSKIGFPYEGIISPLHMNNQHAPYPRFIKSPQSSELNFDRSANQMLFRNPNKHLVHSVSADYFYEVPSNGSSKKLSAALESKNFLKTFTLKRDLLACDSEDDEVIDHDNEGDDDLDDDDDNDSKYEDCDEVFDSDNVKQVDTHRSKRSSLQHATPSNYSYLLKPKRLTSLNKSLNLVRASSNAEESRKRSNTRKLSNSSLLSKLQPLRTDIIYQKVSILAQPITNQIRLTRLFPFRKQNHQANTAHGLHHKQPRAPASPTPIDSSSVAGPAQTTSQQQISDTNEQSALAKSFSEDSSSALLTQQNPTTSSTAISIPTPNAQSSSDVTNNTTCTKSTTSIKRRSETNKSLSTSLDDTLSTIEEKLDDEERQSYTLVPPGQASDTQSRRRLLSSSSSNKCRPMIRSKEIELSDDQELDDIHNSSGVEDEDLDLVTLPTPALKVKLTETTPTISQLETQSILSSSSPSSSLLTDETIKHVVPSSNKPRLTTQLSTPVQQKAHPIMRRSETDLDSDKRALESASSTQMISTGLSRSESSYTNTSSSNQAATMQHQIEPGRYRSSPISQQQQQQPKMNPGGFVQSVRVIKAQQHLLQSMIKHQNQNLLSSSGSKARNAFMYPNRVYQSEYPFVTLKRYPDNMIQCTGGVVSVHSVKLLDHIINDEESETRDIWWTEIRKEIRSHAKALNCNTILGYSETSKVLGDVCVLSACGTAAIMNPTDLSQSLEDEQQYLMQEHANNLGPAKPLQQTLKVPQQSHSPLVSQASMPNSQQQQHEVHEHIIRQNQSIDRDSPLDGLADTTKIVPGDTSMADKIDCSFCHTPLLCADSISSLANCSICQSAKVPDVMLLTIEPPHKLNIVSSGTLVQARVCRAKRDSHGEASAKEIGDALPFLEYELHRQLFTKLKFKGMNCLFNLNIDISAGENMLTGIATGTGCFVLGLPAPDPPQISAGKGIKTSRLNEIQRLISDSSMKNREMLGLCRIDSQLARYRDRFGLNDGTVSANLNTRSPSGPIHEDQIETAQADEDTRDSTETSPTNLDQANLDLKSPDSTQLLSAVKPNPNGASPQEFLNYHQNKRHQSRIHHRRHNHHHHHHHHHHHQHNFNQQSLNRRMEVQPGFNSATLAGPGENLLNLFTDNNNIVLEVDDNEDADIITQLIDSDIPEGYLICNSESIPTLSQSSITSINMFTQVMRVKLTGMDQFAQQFDWILQALFVKLRRSLPCCLSNVSFVVDLPEAHVVQISVTGCLLGLRSSPEQLLAESFGSKSGNLASKEDQTVSAREPISSSLTSLISSESSSTSSASSSSSSASPSSSASSNKSTEPSSKSSSSVQSIREANKAQASNLASQQQGSPATCSPDARGKGQSELKALTKQLSKSNLASLLSGSFDRKKGATQGKASKLDATKAGDIELAEVERTTKATMVTMKQEMQQTRLETTQQPFHSVRAVFKKQQTYPGANSPLISGHDNLLANIIDNSASATAAVTTTTHTTIAVAPTGGGGRTASRRATIILNKVKQPLKGLGSNFNASLSLSHSNSNSDHQAATVSTAATTTSSSATLTNEATFKQTAGPGKTSSSRSARSNLFAQNQSSSGLQAGSISFGNIEHRQDQTASMQMSSARAAINSSIDITSLSYIPGAKEYHYLGNLSFSFVRETNSVRENGGLNGFIHCFLMEVYAIVRAHVSALGGNAFLSFRLQQSCILYHSNKNQAQCLISVAGDAAQVSL